MAPPKTWPVASPIDWIGLSVRWTLLAALPVAAGVLGRMSGGLAVILSGWGLLSLVVGLLWASGWRPRWQAWLVALLDLGFGQAAILSSGGVSSPLWWSLILGIVAVSLAYGMTAGLVITGLAVMGSAALTLAMAPPGPAILIPIGTYAGVLVLAGSALGWLADQTRSAAKALLGQLPAEPQAPLLGRRDSDRFRTVFRLASELNATLNYERVLEMALDLSGSALADASGDEERLISALLLVDGETLRVASARRLPHSDLRVTLPGESGVIGQALSSGDPALSHAPSRDPELQRLVAFHGCATVLCIPLAAGLEAYGVLLFGHPRPGYFSAERAGLLEAIGHQATVALQNARLYHDLELEKERITEIQEEARKKLARDLHDGPTQSIAAIAMRVNFARRLMERDPKAASDELYKVEDLARRTTKEIRHMLFTLRPLILESQGLVATLNQLAEKMRETHGQNVVVEAQPGAAEQLEIGKQGVVFYIAEEAVNNARKHAQARHIWVRLRSRDDLFFLEIEDDGVGFNVGAVDANYEQRGSLGMVNMRERTELVNGLLRVDSTEGIGTRILVVVPLTDESAERLQRTGYPA
ncbi:MAG: GAF domain-containing sensor histidine kinase [Chloroflexota bacterium]